MTWQAYTVYRDLAAGAIFVLSEADRQDSRGRQPAAGEELVVVRAGKVKESAVVIASTYGELTIELGTGHRLLLTPRRFHDGPAGYRPSTPGYTEWTTRQVIART
jgi:hypothetical protein